MSTPSDDLSPLTPEEEAAMHKLIAEEIAPYVAAGTPAALLHTMREQAEQAFRTHEAGRRLLAAAVKRAAPDVSGDVRKDGALEREGRGEKEP